MTKAYQQTEVPVSRSKEAIEKLLRDHGVGAIRTTSLPAGAIVEFLRSDHGRQIPYRIDVTPKPRWDVRDDIAEYNRAERQVWRVLYHHLKALFTAIDFGLMEFHDAFLANLVLADTRGNRGTVGEILGARLANGPAVIESDPFHGLMPALPPAPDRE